MSIPKGSEVDFKEMMTISRDALKLYAEGSLDPNPIHLDDEIAKKAGLKSVIAHGMLIAGLVSNRVKVVIKDELSEEWAISNFRIRFKSITYPNETISVGGAVTKSEDNLVEFSLKAKNGDGEIKTTATVTVSKPS